MNTYTKIQCAECAVPLQSTVADPRPQDTVFCPACGEVDTLKNVLAEARQNVTDQRGDEWKLMLQETTRRSNSISIPERPFPKRFYRFNFDLELQES